MRWDRKRQRVPSRSGLLAATAVRNPKVSERRLDDGGLELSVPMTRSRLARWLSRSGDAPIIRKFELDQLGVEVWRMMDGRSTVREMIERFATAHELNLREAEVSMLAYLRTLAGRGIMVLAMPDDPSGRGKEGRG